jgi:hypothetical protein
VGDTVYVELPAAARPDGKRWVAQRRSLDPDVAMPAFVQLTKLAWQDPQLVLARLRSAAAVHERGRVSDDGWGGRRYAFELTADKRGVRVTGTVDVDQAGRVRRLEVTDRLTTDAGRTAGMPRTVMEFRDTGRTRRSRPRPQARSPAPPTCPSRGSGCRPRQAGEAFAALTHHRTRWSEPSLATRSVLLRTARDDAETQRRPGVSARS